MPDYEPLTMVRQDLENIPAYALPAGYGFRWYHPGDEDIWVALQAPFYGPGAITREVFREYFGSNAELLAERQGYLVDPDGRSIGTITAWTYDGFRHPEYGRIHWVCIAGEHQGRGLSKPMMTIALQRLRGLGHTKAYLTTDRLRPGAVSLYRQFGFVGVEEASGI